MVPFLHVRHARALMLVLAACMFVTTAFAQAKEHDKDRSTVKGMVTSQDGAPVSGALVILDNGGKKHSARSDRRGRFKVERVAFATYVVTVVAPGYATLSGRTIEVAAGDDTRMDLVLEPATPGSMTVIGEVRAAGRGETLSTASAPSVTVNAQSYAAKGATTVAQMLLNLPSLTPSLPLGGGGNAPSSFAIRGPDPTETLVAVDGHQINEGGTGDFDLTLIDPAALQDVQVIYGIAPSSLIGPNTQGGAIDIVTLNPTSQPSELVRGFGGSYSSFGETFQATGTANNLGYAFSAHRATSDGEVNQFVDTDSGPAFVGSAFDGSSLLTKLRYQLGGGYVQIDFRDQTVYKDMSALLTSYPESGSTFANFSGTSLAAHNAGYGFDFESPLGPKSADGSPDTTVQFSHLTSLAAQSVNGPGAETSPYLYNDRDLIGDDWIELDHALPKGELSLKADIRTETLITDFISGQASDDFVSASAFQPSDAPSSPTVSQLTLAQTQRYGVLRYNGDPSNRFHYSLAAYLSDFSTFGWSFDPRAGFVWTPNASTAVRASVGSTFQSPLLTELIVPSPLPPPVNGLVSVGNPNLQPDRATEYDVGWDQLLGATGRQTHVTIDWYRTNLRTPITDYIPPDYNPDCKKKCPLTFPINVGGGVYTGMAIGAKQQVGPDFQFSASWNVGSSYITSSYPGSDIVLGQQTLGEPLHKASFGFERNVETGLLYNAELNYFGTYNQLNRPPFATLDATVAYRWKNFEAGLYGTNLTNVYDGRFTAAGAGVPYGSAGGSPIPTNAYVLQGTKVIVGVSARM
jgi:outer membrane receptor protein involved in Fe transport